MKIVGKGSFPVSNTPFVVPSKYLLVEDSEQKYFALQCKNGFCDRVTAVKAEVSFKDATGKVLSVKVLECDVPDGESGAEFVLNHKIVVGSVHADFLVRILAAQVDGRWIAAEKAHQYEEKKRKQSGAAAQAKSRAVLGLKPKFPIFLVLTTLLLVSFTYLFSYTQLQSYIGSADSFLYRGVWYEFVDNDKSPDSDIVVIGSDGGVNEIVIPEKIQNHTVVAIAENAFQGNEHLKKVTVEGAVEVGDLAFFNAKKLSVVNLPKAVKIGVSAFRGCESLTSVTMENVESIGAYAFQNCTSLASLRAFNLNSIGQQAFMGSGLVSIHIERADAVLEIGFNAFAECAMLQDVTMMQFINFEKNTDIFYGSLAISTLRLKNYNYAFTVNGTSYLDSQRKLSDLFRGAVNRALTELSIEYCGTIPEGFIQNYSYLKKLTVQNLTNKTIGAYAFSGCQSLTDISIPAVSQVDSYAFSKTAITAFDGRELVTIGSSAFSFCTSLKTFDLTDNEVLSEMGAGAFEECTALTTIALPALITEIPERAFLNCSALTGLVTAEGIDVIGESAFSGCTSLKEAQFLYGVTSVGKNAFRNCTQLEALPLAQVLTTIGDYAFRGCAAVKSVTVPISVTRIGIGAFMECNTLAEMTLPFIGGTIGTNNFLAYIFGSTNYASGGTSVPKSLAKVTIQRASEIPAHAFYQCDSIKEIYINDSFSRIGESAFEQCARLRWFVIPASVTQIDKNAFSDCYKLFEVFNLSALSITRSSSDHGNAGYYALKIYRQLQEMRLQNAVVSGFEFMRDDTGKWLLIDYVGNSADITLPTEPITTYGKIDSYQIVRYAFYDHKVIRTAILSGSVTTIGDYAFLKCKLLTQASVGEAVASVGIGAFQDCTALATLSVPYVGGSVTDNRYLSYLFGSSTSSTSAIPNSLKTVSVATGSEVPAFAFFGAQGLQVVHLPTTVTQIHPYAFANCYALKSFNLHEGIVLIGQSAFESCGLTSVSFPSTLTTIEPRAFAACTSLKTITIPDHVQTVGIGAFQDCTAIASMTIRDFYAQNDQKYLAYLFGAQDISDYAKVPAALKTVTITQATQIPANAFFRLGNITTVNLPQSCTRIGAYAFYGCTSLKDLALGSALTQIGEYAFSSCKTFKKVVIPDSVTIVGGSAFSGCTSITDITMPTLYGHSGYRYFSYLFGSMNYADGSYVPSTVKTVTLTQASEIPDYAFYHCTELQTVNLPASVTSIGANAFNSCYTLTTINLPEGIETIKDFAFAYAYALRQITFPSSLERIGYSAFANCGQLEKVTVQGEIMIEDYAFIYASSLLEVRNLGSMALQKGSTSNGYLAYYALVVHALPSITINTATINGLVYKYYEDIWAVSSYTSLPASLTLDTFVHQGKPIYSYTILHGALAGASFERVTIGAAVKSIGEGAFSSCGNLRSVKFENSPIEELPNYAFAYCERLNEITLPQGLTKIGEGAFTWCKSLYRLTLPSTLTEIGSSAFFNCFALSDVYNLSTSLHVTVGSTQNGYVGNYALRVVTSASSAPLDTAIQDDFTFMLYDEQWYLISAPTEAELSLPESFVFEDETVTEYTLLATALVANYRSRVFIPKSVDSIVDGGIGSYYNIERIYYGGSSAEWKDFVDGLTTYEIINTTIVYNAKS